MRYIGSKTSTLADLEKIITAKVANGSFCDAFGGLGTVGSHFKKLGFRVLTGDPLQFAHYFQIARIRRQRVPAFKSVRENLGFRGAEAVINHLNEHPSSQSWFAEEYAKKRQFFTVANADAIDGSWKAIKFWKEARHISQDEYAILTASLIHSMDKVANTAGTYYAHLKGWTRKALQSFKFELIPPTPGRKDCDCFHGLASDLVADRHFDVLYLDPPYNERSYAHYYHLPETIAAGIHKEVHGASGIPNECQSRSIFNDRKRASSALTSLLEAANFRLLAFHYSDDGLIPIKDVRSILMRFGKVEEHLIRSKGYTTEKSSRQILHRLYIVSNE